MPTDRPTKNGVQFTSVDGRRSSQRAGKAVFADAVRDVDEAVAASVESAKDWRKDYMTPVRSIVRAGAASGKDALRIASDGLASLRRNLTFVRDGSELGLAEAVAASDGTPFETVTVEGSSEAAPLLEVPYKGNLLGAGELRAQLDRWVDAGIMEPSCADALKLVVDNPAWLDLSDLSFALLGAASEMGPLIPLTQWRAHVIAVDLPRRHLWEHILGVARAGNGRVSIPTTTASSSEVVGAAGADLMTDAPRVGAWLETFDRLSVVGNYVYADGADFVRLAAIVDALVADILDSHPDTASAYLATPTDVFAVPEEVAEATRSSRRARPHHGLIRALTRAKLYAPNYSEIVEGDGRRWGLADSLVPIQGANYALAKSVQRWRAILAREEGRTSSANVAPASHTRSVTKNRMLAAAYRGAPRFGVEIFSADTTRVLMAALLVHDLRNPAAAARPQTPLDHPYDLFAQGALHGGIWRLPYEPRSVLPLALIRGAIGSRAG